MIVREARLADAAAMGRVTVDTFLAAHHGQIPDVVWERRRKDWTHDVSARAWERALRQIADGTNPQDCVYVAEAETGEIIGVAMAGVDADCATAEVYSLYVHPRHQMRGVGRRLVAAVAAHVVRQGVARMTIAVLEANAPARRFYEALGGQAVGERPFEEAGFQLPELVYAGSDVQKLGAESA
jgi:ribosomal protein S18 acetylase RimI-like enzyme